MIDSRDVARLKEVVAGYDKPTATKAFRDYYSRHHTSIRGWLSVPIMTVVGVVVDLQTRAGFQGGFAEIGVHHGRFYCALATARESGWRGIAIDIFEDQHLNPDGSGKGSLQIFRSNMQRIGLDLADHTIVQSDSKIVSADRIRAAVGGDGVLVFSVDGAHTVDYTVADLELAARALHPCGVIILDDLLNPRWPGVIEGALDWLRGPQGSAYEMIAYGNNKGFIARREVASAYRSLLTDRPDLSIARGDAVVFAGRPCLSGRFGDPAEVFGSDAVPGEAPPAAADKMLEFVRGGNGSRSLREGWSKPETHGTWSCAERASLGIPVGRHTSVRNCRIELSPFLPPGQSQHLKVLLAGREVASLDLTGGTQTIDVALAPSDVAGADTIDLTLQTAQVFNPAALGLSRDTRNLGVMLKRITVSA